MIPWLSLLQENPKEVGTVKKTYETPKLELIKLDSTDILTASLPNFNDENILGDGWVEA